MDNVFISVNDIKHDDYKWIDARFSMKSAKIGKEQYAKSHVVGAVHWDLNDHLSDSTKNEGRNPMPEKEALIELFQSSGLELEDDIIVYDNGGSPFATRAWYFLQFAGFKSARIAREGFAEIEKAGVPVTSEVPRPTRTTVQPVWNEAIYAARPYVEGVVSGKNESLLLDARAAKRFRGEVEPLDSVAGRIPGASNYDWEQLVQDGAFRFDEPIKNQLEQIAQSAKEVTVYCGSGVSATPIYAMLAHYGHDNIRLYVGSYSDWISVEGAKVEKG